MKVNVNTAILEKLDIKKLINVKEYAPIVILSSLIPYLFLHLGAFQVTYKFNLFGNNCVFKYANPYVILIVFVYSLLLSFFVVGYSLSIVKCQDKSITFGTYLSTLQWNSYVSYIFKVGFAVLIALLGYFVFIIPGVILSIVFIFVPFISIDQKDLSLTQTYRLSARLIKCNYEEFFALIMSLIPNEFLSAITFKLYDFRYTPLKFLSFAKLYLQVKVL